MSGSWITVTTTLPQSLGFGKHDEDVDSPPEIRTERLIIRPLTQSDLRALHRLRRQPEFMKHTATGLPDPDIRATQAKLDSLLNAPTRPDAFPFPTYFGIFLKSTGQLIGDGGVHLLASPACGWPELGCKFGTEYCRQGYGTEFLRAFTAWWWALPRSGVSGGDSVPVRLRVHPDSVVWDRKRRDRNLENASDRREGGGDDEYDVAIEQIYAWVAPDNYASQKMVIKTGLEHFVTWEHPVKKVPVLGWRQSRYRRSAHPSKL
ncbi:acetyltransferase domain-containing protein [Xylaria nigripes]|nr:acetyltransferase domain-containing protein [Xylaria nigripes]